MEWLIAYLLLGTFVGFFAGLFGIGGGLVMVPILTFWFEEQQLLPNHNLHLALGTSMAAIIFSACYSSYTHYKHQAVEMSAFKAMSPWLFIGTFTGALVATQIEVKYLSLFFTGFVILSALQMLLNIRPKPSRMLPNTTKLALSGGVIGIICSLVSIGGGVLNIPYLLYHNIPIRKAIGTSAALGIPIALGGSLAYFSHETLASQSIGLVYLPALIMLALGSLSTTWLGAKATHKLPQEILRTIFALFLIGLAIKLTRLLS